MIKMEEVAPMSKAMKELDNLNSRFAIDDFGTSTNPMQHQTDALKARIFHGATGSLPESPLAFS